MGAMPSWENSVIRADSWDELVDFIKTEGANYGWELREVSPTILKEEDIKRYRERGVPQEELPPKFMELWGNRSCYLTLTDEPAWVSEESIKIGFAGVSYLFNAASDMAKSRNLYLIKLDDLA